MARESKRPRERFATVARRMWNDEVFRAWSAPPANAQTLWQFILTSPDAGSIPGLFRFSVAATAERFAWSTEDTRRCLDEIVASERAEYDPKSQLLFLPNALRWNEPESPNVVRGWWRQWSELPECSLKKRAEGVFRRHVGAMGQPFADAIQACISGLRGKSSPKEPQTLPRRIEGSIPDSGSEDKKIRGQEIPPKPPQGGAGPAGRGDGQGTERLTGPESARVVLANFRPRPFDSPMPAPAPGRGQGGAIAPVVGQEAVRGAASVPEANLGGA